MAQHPPRTRLEQRVQETRLSVLDFVKRFTEVAADSGENAHTSTRQTKRWLAGDCELPRAVSCRVLESWFGEPVEQLFGPPNNAIATAEITEEELVVNAGRESAEHAIEAAAALDPSALEHLHAAAQNAAEKYYIATPLQMLTELVRLRDTVYEQLDRTHKPRQQAELYLLAGQVCGLLSSVSWDMGHTAVAEEQARAAHTYGCVTDQRSLQAWARSLQVTTAFWSGRPRRAAALAATALETAPSGTASVRLHSVHARALAMVGAKQEVAAALNSALDELDRAGDDPFLDETGGELGFDRSRYALCASSAYIALGDADRAETEASAALELFGQQREVRWSAGESGARIDLATARTMRGDLAGTEDALIPVFALAPERRTEALALRLDNLSRVLGLARFRGAIEASRVGDAIEDFTAHRLARSTARPAIEP